MPAAASNALHYPNGELRNWLAIARAEQATLAPELNKLVVDEDKERWVAAAVANPVREGLVDTLKAISESTEMATPESPDTAASKSGWSLQEKIISGLAAGILAVVGLMWHDMTAEVKENTKAISDLRVDTTKALADARVELTKSIDAVVREQATTNQKLDDLINATRQKR
jgi:hypothetical protein